MFKIKIKANHNEAEKHSGIKILSNTAEHEHGFLMLHGFVRNSGERRLEDIVAVAECYTADGRMVKKADMMLDDLRIEPEEVSSYTIATEDNTDIEMVKISFKRFLGEMITTMETPRGKREVFIRE